MSWTNWTVRDWIFKFGHVFALVLWIGAVLYGLHLFYSNDVKVSAIYGTKIIKLISLVGIIVNLFIWLAAAERRGLRSLSVAICAAVWTLIISGFILYDVLFAYWTATGGKAVVYKAKDLKGVIFDNLYPLSPVLILGILNGVMCWRGSRDGGDGGDEARAYLVQIDLPCIITSIIVFSVAALSNNIADPSEMALILSGTMSFLVFLVFFNETLLGCLKNY